jgi:predicted nucleotidyltransferase
MDINELESFKLSDAVAFHQELNPKLWDNEKLDPEVRDQLLLIAEDFVEYLGISNLNVRDVTISGSNAAYSYTPHSDLDLHVLVDFNELPNNEVYQELFTAKKTLYNDAHDITVREVPVELYVQDTNNPVQSLGEYSIVQDKWIRIPKKRRANFDQAATKLKYEKLGELIELALASKDSKRVNDTIALVKRYRKSGLDKAGEFGPENLAYKAVRKQGLVQALHDLKVQLHTEKLSIEESDDEKKATLKIQKHLNKKYGANLDLDGKLGPLTLKSINKFMPRAKTGLADEPNKTTAVQGKKLKEAPRTFQPQTTPIQELISDYNYFTSFGTVHLEKQGKTPEAQKELLALVQRLQKDAKVFGSVVRDKKKMEANRDTILTHIYQMMTYAIPILKKNLPADDWEAKRGQINSVLTSYNNVSKINESSGTNLVYRVDKTKIPNFEKNLKTYYHNDDWSMSGSEWEGATGSAKGLYAHPDKLFVALYAAGTPETNRYVATYNTSPPMVYFDKKDVPEFKNTKSYLTAFDASTFKKVPSGEAFSDTPGKPVHQIEITDPFKFIKQQGWDIKLVDDLPAKLKEIQKIAKQKDIKVGAEGMGLTESSEYSQYENEIENFVQSLNPDDVGVEEIGPYHVHFEGFTDECQQDAERRCNLPSDSPQHLASYDDVYKEVIRDFVRREGGEQPLKVGFAGYQDYPVIYAVFDNPEPYKKPDAWNPKIDEASGYIPSTKEKNDPRFKTALTVDVKPDAIKKNAKAFGFKTSRAGIPPQARADGKINENVSQKSGSGSQALVNDFLSTKTNHERRFYAIRDNCGPAASDMRNWLENTKGIKTKRVRGEFVADDIVSEKADFTPDMKKEFISAGLDWNSPEDRYNFIKNNPKYATEWKKIPHYWLTDKSGEIYDPTGYIQFINTGLATDLNKRRYIPESQARADGKIAEDLMREFKTFLGEQQEEMFPGYDKEHREKRLGNWLAKSWGVQNGKPQTFYHATTKDFDTFNTHGTGFASALGMAYEVERHGSFFAVDPKFAEGFIEDPNTGRVKEGGRVLPVHLSIQSPIDLRDDALSRMLSDEETVDEFKANDIDLRSIYNHFYELERWELFDGPEGAEFIDNLQKLGFDGAIINEAIPNNSNAKSGQVWVAFSPNQVKSVYNRGSFSPDDPRLTKESG